MPKKMRVFYDTEFKENGYTVDLISIGMVREDGQEYYAVSNEFNTHEVAIDWWLMENVMSSIEHVTYVRPLCDNPCAPMVRDLYVTDPAAKSRKQIKEDILVFTSDIWPEFWAWYGAYDHVALCQLFGRMIDLPDRFPMFTMDIKQLHKEAGNPDMPEQPPGKHNALEDARWNVVRYNFLKGLLSGNAENL